MHVGRIAPDFPAFQKKHKAIFLEEVPRAWAPQE
jgi:hypothetical protein